MAWNCDPIAVRCCWIWCIICDCVWCVSSLRKTHPEQDGLNEVRSTWYHGIGTLVREISTVVSTSATSAVGNRSGNRTQWEVKKHSSVKCMSHLLVRR